MIKVSGVSKNFDGFQTLDNFSLNVQKGVIYGLVGPNGAGKTTIINHLTGVLRQDSGSISIDGEDVWENSGLKQRVLSIADDWFYFATFTIRDMMKFYRSIYKSFNEQRYEKLKEIFQMDEKQQIRRLSKGMKKQVAFWLVLSCMPKVLILDEPLDGLDPIMRKQILSVIINDVAEREMTVLVSSHNLRELEDICDYVGIMFKGTMLAEKPLDDLKGEIHKYQTAFKGGMPQELKTQLEILDKSDIGAINTLIIRGNSEEIDRIIGGFSPLVCEHVKLTLEEVFIYELGGMGYDYKKIIL